MLETNVLNTADGHVLESLRGSLKTTACGGIYKNRNGKIYGTLRFAVRNLFSLKNN
jgi:hypothetical protein